MDEEKDRAAIRAAMSGATETAAPEWDGEIYVTTDRVVARCLYPACEFSVGIPREPIRWVVKESTAQLAEHQYNEHFEKGKRNRINLVFADGVTL